MAHRRQRLMGGAGWLAMVVAAGGAGCRRPALPVADEDPLPHRYFLVGAEGAPGLAPGWGVAITAEESRPGGARYGRTRGGRWVPLSHLVAAPVTSLHGARLDGELAVAWVVDETAPVFARADAASPAVESRRRFDQLRLVDGAPAGWLKIGEARYLRRVAARVPRTTPRPPDVGSGDHWIDVDRATQTLVAYAGDRPLFATLVSTGTDAHPTPSGRYRVRAKLRTADMDNLERPATPEVSHYFVEAVPWVQYFHGTLALHGAFWHQRFGHPRSHGCINLTPADARWLFDFTRPSLPQGGDEARADGDGTLVQVR